jgi:hypothetical protein
MNRRHSLFCLLGLGLAAASGCDKLSFMPQAKRKKVGGYDAITNGMTEAQVKKELGEPTRRSGYNLEGGKDRAVALTYAGSNSLITITMVRGAVVGKQKY